MKSFTGLAEFVRVVETRSFTKAGENLGRSPSAVSKAVSGLEDRLGVRLLHRSTRSLSLTADGELFYDHAVRALSEIETAARSLVDAATTPQGRLRIDAPIAFGRLHVVPLLRRYLETYPDVNVDIRLDDRMVDPVRDSVDVVVRIGELEDSSLISRVLAPTRLVLCGAPDYLDRAGTPSRIEDLAGHNCITGRRSTWSLVRNGQRTDVGVSGTVTTNSAEGLRHAALAGIGLVQVRTFAIWRDIERGALRQVMPDQIVADLPVCVAYANRRHVSPRVRSFLDFLISSVTPQPYWDAPFPGSA